MFNTFNLLLCAQMLSEKPYSFCDFNYYLSSLQVDAIVHISICFTIFCVLFLMEGIDFVNTKKGTK